jgi:hypothetical protein
MAETTTEVETSKAAATPRVGRDRGCRCPSCRPIQAQLAPCTWPEALYALIEVDWIAMADRAKDLRVCVAHRGRHAFYLDGCSQLPPHRAGPPPGRCEEEGCERAAYIPHAHPRRIEVTLDEDVLAGAIVKASRTAREEARAAARPRVTEASDGEPKAPFVPTLRRPSKVPLPVAGDEERTGGFEP